MHIAFRVDNFMHRELVERFCPNLT